MLLTPPASTSNPPALQQQTSSNSAYIPSRKSAANLEAMLGSSLASAINSTEQQQQQRRLPTKASSNTPVTMNTPLPLMVEKRSIVRAQSADGHDLLPGYSSSNLQHNGVAPTIPIPIPSGAGARPLHHHHHELHTSHMVDDNLLARSYPPSNPSPVSYVAATEELYGSTSTIVRAKTERIVAATRASKAVTAMNNVGNGSTSSSSSHSQRSSLFETTAGVELVQFLLETESHALILFNVETVPVDVFRMAAENLGSLVYIRMDHKASKGVVFLAYQDLRAAIRAFHTLPREFAQHLATERPVVAHYSIMLNAANTPRDGILLVKDVHASVSESDVHAVFSAYGQLKNVHRRISNNGPHSNQGPGVEFFLVEYYDVQDAKFASFELSSLTPWGRNIVVEEAERPEKERALGQQLLLTLRRWGREEQRGSTFSSVSNMSTTEECASPNSSPNVSPAHVMYIKNPYHHQNPTSPALSPPLVAYPSSATHHTQQQYGVNAAGSAGSAAAAYCSADSSAEDNLCSSLQGMWVPSPHGNLTPGSPTSGKRSPPTGAYFPRRGMKREVLGMGMSEAEYQLDVDKVVRGLDKRVTLMVSHNYLERTTLLKHLYFLSGTEGHPCRCGLLTDSKYSQ